MNRNNARHPLPSAARLEPLERRVLMSAGSPDPSFGAGGQAFNTLGFADRGQTPISYPVPNGSTGVVVRPNGSIIALGPSLDRPTGPGTLTQILVRYLPDGTIDPRFYANQFATQLADDALGAQRDLTAIAAGPNGSVYVGGREDFGGLGGGGSANTYIARVNADGTATVSPTLLPIFRVGAIAVQSDGKILVAGESDPTRPSPLTFARLNPDFTLDATFGSNGILTCGPTTATSSGIRALAIDAAGNIYGVGGLAGATDATTGAVIVRLTPAGQLDATFGTAGIFMQALLPGSGSYAKPSFDDIALLPGGNLVVSGSVGGGRFVLGEYAVSTGAGLNVPRLTGPGLAYRAGPAGGSSGDGRSRLALAPDGSIVTADLAGNLIEYSPPGRTFGQLARYRADGTLDPAFGTAGIEALDPALHAAPGDVAVMPDGRIVTADFDTALVARYVPDAITLGFDGSMIVTGTDGNDVLTVGQDAASIGATAGAETRAFAAADVKHIFVAGGAGDDSIFLAPLTRLGATVSGGPGNDTIVGSAAADRIRGNAGADSISGGAGADTLDGGNGNDTLAGGPGDDSITGGAGDDLLLGGAGDDTLAGQDGNDTLRGAGGNDSVVGGAGDNLLAAGAGNNAFVAGPAGNDDVSAHAGDTVVGSAHVTPVAGAGTPTLRALPDGASDPTFGVNGTAVPYSPNPLASSAAIVDIAAAPGGATLALLASTKFGAAAAAVARFAADGTFDPSFGVGGIASLAVPGGDPIIPQALAVDAAGRILVAQQDYGQPTAVVRRLLPGGAIDPTFGTAGVASIPLSGSPVAVFAAPDGGVVVVGSSRPSNPQFCVARFTSNGQPDAAVGNGSGLVFGPQGQQEVVAGAIDAAGRFLLTGANFTPNEDTPDALALVRYNPDGTPDPTFGAGGNVVGPIASQGGALLVQPDGKIVVAATNAAGDLTALLRYNPDGTPDVTFGRGGAVPFTVQPNPFPRAIQVRLALQPDGRILVVAGEDTADGKAGEVFRVNPDGTLDTSFASAGVADQFTSAAHGPLNRILLATDGTILLSESGLDRLDRLIDGGPSLPASGSPAAARPVA